MKNFKVGIVKYKKFFSFGARKFHFREYKKNFILRKYKKFFRGSFFDFFNLRLKVYYLALKSTVAA